MVNPWWTDSVALLRQPTFPRLFVATLLGMCVGAERQWRQRAAGLRTNTLVCFGAAAFVDLGLTIAPGTTQVVAYVVSGVGFLGAGAIMKDGANVRGLNTAATLWCSAAVGACVGAGEMLDGIFVTVMLLTINSVLRPLARFIDRRSLADADTRILYRLRVACGAGEEQGIEHEILHLAATCSLAVRETRLELLEDGQTALVQVIVESATHAPVDLNGMVNTLRQLPRVRSVECTKGISEGE